MSRSLPEKMALWHQHDMSPALEAVLLLEHCLLDEGALMDRRATKWIHRAIAYLHTQMPKDERSAVYQVDR